MAAPSEAAIQIGQKLIPPAMMIVPMPISAAQAGSSSEMKASDSPNASRKTTERRPSLVRLNKFDDDVGVAFESLEHLAGGPWRALTI